ncbi:SPT2 chromatin protein (macronuclear) [Tetrahymena thermophila SB210]|uniref:SPT2 chromatin protein n=1 Tax=Tetrahymena thermophila (strain SB210) TaxID=312017 RepID=I7M2V8_TETTS|nr:SPT2 chromatin protein [Tetrahymena thermophila SB210]EAS01393.1 SPT2 chromatin protein [Tetrahymena thermophila SB210]|eukprot:XP_001021639.1 SPT2 chromatin protein [Tetrahymena thermophila SB210]
MNQLSFLLSGQDSEQFNGGEGPAQQIKIETKPSSQTKDLYAHQDQTTALLSKYSVLDTASQLQQIDSTEMKKIKDQIERKKKQTSDKDDDDDFDVGPIIKRKVDNDVAVNLKSTSSSSISNQPSQNSISSKAALQSSVPTSQNLAQQKVNKLDEKVSQKNATNSQRDQALNQQAKKAQNGSSEKPKVNPSQSESNLRKPQPNPKVPPTSASQANARTQQIQNQQNKQSTTQNNATQRMQAPPQKNSMQSQQKVTQNKATPLVNQKTQSIPAQKQASQLQKGTNQQNQQNPQKSIAQNQQQRPINNQQQQQQRQQPNNIQKRPVDKPNGQNAVSKQNMQNKMNANQKQQQPQTQKPGLNQQQNIINQQKLAFQKLPPEKQLQQLQNSKLKLEKNPKKTPQDIQKIEKLNVYIQKLQKIIQQRQNKAATNKNQNNRTQQQNRQATNGSQKPQNQQQRQNQLSQLTTKEKVKIFIDKLNAFKKAKSLTPEQVKQKERIIKYLQDIKKKSLQQKQLMQSKLSQEQKQKEEQRRIQEQRQKQMRKNQQAQRDYDYEDEYDLDDSFIADDGDEFDQELQQDLYKIIKKDKIQKLAQKNDKIKIEESNIYQIKREEKISDRIGRIEDAKEQELIKKEKMELKKKKGLTIDSDDDDDIDQEDEDEEEEEEEQMSYDENDSFIVYGDDEEVE